MKREYTAYTGDGGEVLVLPSITPNPDQKRVGVRIGIETIWLRSADAKEMGQQLIQEAKP